MSILTRIIAMFGGAIAVEYLVAGGGGSGGVAVDGTLGQGGHGGAGGFKQGTLILSPGSSRPVSVGVKGEPSVPATGSAFGDITVSGGGRGGDTLGAGQDGASGGGGGNTGSGFTAGGLGVPGEGHDGGRGSSVSRGGGGGAAGPGDVGSVSGPGVVSSISGVPVTYCVGGESSAGPGSGGQGGSGGPPIPGKDGVVIARYFGPQRATGGMITSVGGYTIHTFTGPGTFAL